MRWRMSRTRPLRARARYGRVLCESLDGVVRLFRTIAAPRGPVVASGATSTAERLRVMSLATSFRSCGSTRRLRRRSCAARVQEGVGQESDVFLHPCERTLQVDGLQARPHVVALRVGPHEPVQALQPIPHQLRLAQFLGHRRYPLVCRPELGSFSFHRRLPITCTTFYATRSAGLSYEEPLSFPRSMKSPKR